MRRSARLAALRLSHLRLKAPDNNQPAEVKPGSHSDDSLAEISSFEGRGAPAKGLGVMLSAQLKNAQQQQELAQQSTNVQDAMRKNQAARSEKMLKAQMAREAASKHISVTSPVDRVRAVITGEYDPSTHFLLLDLDYEKDALIFGSTREEFYENVEKMKQVVIEYHRWERSDRFYKYGTRIAQVLTAFFVYDSWEQERFKVLLASSLDNFRKIHEEELDGIERRRIEALERAVEELEARPPNFDELVKRRKAIEDEVMAEYKRHPMDTRDLERAKQDAEAVRRQQLSSSALSPSSVPAVKNLRRVLMPQTSDWTVIVREEMLEYKAAKEKNMRVPNAPDTEVPDGLRRQMVTPIITAAPKKEPKPATA